VPTIRSRARSVATPNLDCRALKTCYDIPSRRHLTGSGPLTGRLWAAARHRIHLAYPPPSRNRTRAASRHSRRRSSLRKRGPTWLALYRLWLCRARPLHADFGIEVWSMSAPRCRRSSVGALWRFCVTEAPVLLRVSALAVQCGVPRGHAEPVVPSCRD